MIHISNNAKKTILLVVLLLLIVDALFMGFFNRQVSRVVERMGGPSLINQNARYSGLPGRSGMVAPKVAIVTYFFNDKAGADLRRLSWAIQQKYAAHHGYDIYDGGVVPVIQDRLDGMREKMHNFFYFKYVTTLEILRGGEATGGKSYDWVIWIDPDSIYLNHGKRYEDVLDQRFDVIFTVGPPDNPQWTNVVNAGSFAVRNSDFGRIFLEDVISMSQNHCGEFLIENPEASAPVNGWIQLCNPDGSYWLSDQGILMALYLYKQPEYRCHFKKTWFRAFSSEFPWYNDGDLMVHFPGRSLEDRRRLIKAFTKFSNFNTGKVDRRYTDTLDTEDTLTNDLIELEGLYRDSNPICSY